MLNKILIKMIIKQMIKDITELYFVDCTFKIKNKEVYYEITITACLIKNNTIITKHKNIYVKNWVELITKYDYIKEKLKTILIENIKEGIC